MSRLTAYDKFIQVALKYGFSLFGLPKTSQTTVTRTGDDGTYQKGYPKSGTRFIDNGNGTVTDNATGLMWAKDGLGAGCMNGSKDIWDTVIDYCNNLNFAGYTDWRLPNMMELMSISDYSRQTPALNLIFTNSLSQRYWSSTHVPNYPTYAFEIDFNNSITYVDLKTISRYVRAVRGG